MLALQTLLAYGLWLSVTDAAVSVPAQTDEVCYTKRATAAVKSVPTHILNTAWTVPQLGLTTYTPSVVKTPSKVTTTTTLLITSGTDTSILPTQTGYLPTKSTILKAELFAAKKRAVSRVQRGLIGMLLGDTGILGSTKQKTLDRSQRGKPSYPVAITCYKKKTTATITLSPPVALTTLIFTTLITETFTNAPSTTTTLTVSQTVTIPIATSISYGAANGNNSVGRANGAYITNTYYDSSTQNVVYTDDTDMTSCSNSCFSTPSCAQYQLITYNAPPEMCMLVITNDACNTPNMVPGNSVSVDGGAGPGDVVVVGNGICGKWDSVSS
ncbi:hypothetical protein HYALB_00010519 [Hymenoscyphus albidus]|uniref:Apple domain-containing protein n=1 Tax=Hymenoscyphus albidus TaxID=595503 RepID=A0A9N9M078_9HELO|nr:hypothetical protein HYALB_00010519 [Hymenoscyphus albidus]